MPRKPTTRHCRILPLLLSSLCMLAALPQVGHAQEARASFLSDYNVSYISMDEGLTHNYVDELLRDSSGFIWVATGGGGLSRYDGYEFVNFSPNSTHYRIKSNFVWTVAEDPFKRLWVASEGGIDVIDLTMMATVEPADSSGALAAITTVFTQKLTIDAVGHLWIQNTSGIYCIQFDDSGNIKTVSTLPHPIPSSANGLAIKDVYGDGSVWVALSGVVHELTVGGDGTIHASPVAELLRFDSDIFISDYELKDGDVWISSNQGLYRYNKRKSHIKLYQHDPGDAHSLSQNFLTDICVTADKRLIVASLQGLNVYNPINDDFERVKATAKRWGVRGLNNDFINCLLVDGDQLWVATEGCGINKLTPKRLYAEVIRHRQDDPTSLACNPVNAILEDSEGTVWVGVVEGGLNRSSDNLLTFTHYRSEGSGLSHNSVSALAEDSQRHLWVGTWGGGIDVVERDNPAKRIAHIESTSDGAHRLDYVGMLIYDRINHAIWIGTNNGLYYCDISSLSVTVPLNGAALSGCLGAQIDAGGHLWVGSSEGLYDIDLRSRPHADDAAFSYRHLRQLDDGPQQRTVKVISLALAADGSLWIGTNGDGVYHRRVEGDRELFVNYNTHSGLSNDIVLGILEDYRGYIWVSTYHGLSCLLPDGTAYNYDAADGLVCEQFYWNAAGRMRNGRLLFGSIDGMVAIDGQPPLAQHANGQQRVAFTRLTVGDEPVYGGSKIVAGQRDVSAADAITIHERDKSVGVEFSALDFVGGNTGRYFYRLTGFDDNWRELPPGRRYVVYTNLEHGRYELQVKYLSGGLTLDEAEASTLTINVRPYFYKQPWFVLSVLTLLLAAALLFYRWRIAELKRQRSELQRAVSVATAEIEKQRQLLEVRASELSQQNSELVRRNDEITQQKTQLAEMANRVRELTMDRIAFFTNITHELRTPIALIIGPIERALKLSYNPKVIEQLHYVERNSRYLLSLVNQLMDFRKVESGKMEIVRNRGDFAKFTADLMTPFEALAESRGMTLRRLCRIATEEIVYDEDALSKVLTNLLSNALKFTPDGGRVTLYAALLPKGRCGSDTATLYISVSDTGCGIAEADVDKVFEKFYQGKSSLKFPIVGSSGSGIGLYLCHSIVELYGGHISVHNNRGGRGCTFRVLLPTADDAATEASALPMSVPVAELPAPMLPPVATGGARLTILVVEDNADMRGFLRSILSDRYNVVEADDGKQALKLLHEQTIDFIISDLMMPVMDGLELSRQVKEDFSISHIPFLMLTAKTSQETRLESYRIGVDEYLQKPFDEDLLLARIQSILDNKRRYQRQFADRMEVADLSIEESSPDRKFMDDVMAVIQQNYKNSYFRADDFAEALGISCGLLNRKLKNLAGQSAVQMLHSFRMNQARELLLQNRHSRQMNVSEIAYEVGFNDSKYFSKCFAKQFNVLPSQLLDGK